MKNEDLNEMFRYHEPKGDQLKRYDRVRGAAKALAEAIIEVTAPSADQSAAIRKVREAMMTANAAIALGPAELTGKSHHKTTGYNTDFH